ncbi:MAG: GNAT family N-acetyltransferase [Phycisphaerae bacterium]
MVIRIVQARSGRQIARVRELLSEYVAELGLDLGFQDFATEFADLPGRYAPGRGCLLLAMAGWTPVGCVAMRPLGRTTCELKRMYVRPRWRGRGVGRRLAMAVIASARRARYKRIRLDTIPKLREATALYRSLGFAEIAPYYKTPLKDALFMELAL